MLTFCQRKIDLTTRMQKKNWRVHDWRTVRVMACALAVLTAAAGCQSDSQSSKAAIQAAALVSSDSANTGKSMLLQEGDVLKIDFPGDPTINTVVTVRRDGKVSLPLVGEYEAAGKTPAMMETELKKMYSPQLVNNELSVNVQSSAFVVYIMGAVARPGKLVSDRPLTVLQALIESGLDDSRSNMKKIEIFRTDPTGKSEKTTLNYYNYLHKKGTPLPVFTLRPYDVINVPQKYSWY